MKIIFCHLQIMSVFFFLSKTCTFKFFFLVLLHWIGPPGQSEIKNNNSRTPCLGLDLKAMFDVGF